MGWGIQVSRRSPTLNTGRLRNRVSIVRVSPVQDSTGGFDLSADVLYANVWASVESESGNDSANGGGGFVSKVKYQVVLRYLAGVTANMQMLFNGQQYQIEAVENPDGRNKMLLLTCMLISDSAQQQAPTIA
ncbi:MAG: phage head closure protein [Candidatus Sulfotelmatobacter sp.]